MHCRRGTFYGGPESFLRNFGDRGPAPEYGFGGRTGHIDTIARKDTPDM